MVCLLEMSRELVLGRHGFDLRVSEYYAVPARDWSMCGIGSCIDDRNYFVVLLAQPQREA